MHSEPFGDPVKIGIKQKFAKLALRRNDPKEITQMVKDRKKDSRKWPGKQGPESSVPEPNKINASTPYDFAGKNLTPYGGVLPGITMLEICECAAWECCPADAEHHANHARTCLGGGQREVEGGHHRHRHHRANALRPEDGGGAH